MDTNKAAGVDGIPVRFIKAHPASIGRLIARLVNHSITSGIFPDLWKYAVVTPIQKSKESMELTNFRPISVLPVLSKVLERVVYDQLLSHLSTFDLLSDKQSGFRPQCSTQDVFLHVTECWRDAIDRSMLTAAAFLDISKAFNCVNHDILLSKLACYGVMDDSLVWFASYLSSRMQRVCLQGSSSGWGLVRAGVPQGSILGPLLFSIYVNNLPAVVHNCQLSMYADDMEIHCSNADLSVAQYDLQNDLNSIHLLMAADQSIESKCGGKSHVMLIGSRQKLQNHELCITVGSTQLSRVPFFRYLGIYIDETLSWQGQTQKLYQRVQSRVHCLYRLRPLPDGLMGKLYHTFVLPILDYWDAVWSPSSVAYSRKLERLYSKFCSLIPDSRGSFHHTLTERRRFHTASVVYKILHQQSPSYLRDTFKFAVDVTSHAGRNVHRLFIPRVRTTYGKAGLYYKGAQIWNALDPSLYIAATLKEFKITFI